MLLPVPALEVLNHPNNKSNHTNNDISKAWEFIYYAMVEKGFTLTNNLPKIRDKFSKVKKNNRNQNPLAAGSMISEETMNQSIYFPTILT